MGTSLAERFRKKPWKAFHPGKRRRRRENHLLLCRFSPDRGALGGESLTEAAKIQEPLSRPVWRFNVELLCILADQSLPAEFHALGANDSSNGLTGQKSIQHVEADVPARGAP